MGFSLERIYRDWAEIYLQVSLYAEEKKKEFWK